MERVERKKAHKKKTRGRRNMTRKTVWNWETKRPKRGAAQNEKHDRWTSNAHQKRPKQKKTKQKRKRKKQENTRVFCSVCKAIIDFPNKGPASARTNKHWPKTRKTGGKKKLTRIRFFRRIRSGWDGASRLLRPTRSAAHSVKTKKQSKRHRPPQTTAAVFHSKLHGLCC